MQAAKAATPTKPVPLPACDQPIERFADENTSVTIPTTTIRTNKVEHASRCTRARKPVRALPHCLYARYDYIVTPAGVLSAALLFLPLAALACPIGWTPSPTNATWGPRCYLIPRERSTSLFRCADLCTKHGGVPGCIGSAEENAFVTAELAEAEQGLWLGLYQIETGLGPAKEWSRCVGSDAPSFTDWHEGQPDDYHGYQQDCAWVTGNRTGRHWRALACDGGVRFDEHPWWLAELSCLCAHGNASAAFAHYRKALEATSGNNQRLLSRRRTARSFSDRLFQLALPGLCLYILALALYDLSRYGSEDTRRELVLPGAAP